MNSFRCSLFDFIPEESTGKPTFFISHTWSEPLNALLALLKRHFKVTASSDKAAAIILWLVR